MVALYELAEARGILNQMLDEMGGEWTPEIEELYEGLKMERDVKVERTALFIRERKAYVEMVKTERDRLDAIVKTNARAIESLTDYLHRNMLALDCVKVVGKLCTVALQKNAQPTITCTVETKDLPFALRREVLQVSLDRQAVLEHWAQGAALPPGIVVHQETHVRIR